MPGSETPAVGAFGLIESRLLRADRVRLSYHVTASGAVDADLRGELVTAGDEGTLTARGTFAGGRVRLALRTAGDTYTYGPVGGAVEAPTPAALHEALILGLTRMGILHNLARLTAGAPPEHAGGGVGEWVRVEGLRVDSTAPVTLQFAVRVADREVGEAVLVLGPDGLPRIRRQTVRFPEGEMHVVERYSDVVVEP